MERLTEKQLQALEYLCSGLPLSREGYVLGIRGTSFQNRLVIARAKAGLKSRSQLIFVYGAWRVAQNGGRS